MTNTYSTGNPLGSTSPKDLYDNASNFDDFSVGISANFIDRFGESRLSLKGMEYRFSDFLSASGYEYLGAYASGLTIDRQQQYFSRAGLNYRAIVGTALPYVLTGDWSIDGPKFLAFDVNNVLAQDLASTDAGKGARLVSFSQFGMQLQGGSGITKKGFWIDIEDGANITRIRDRVFIGDASINDGKLTNTVKDWLETERFATTNNSNLAVLSTIGQTAAIFGSRTSDINIAGGMGCIGGQFWAINDNTAYIQTAYALYGEARRKAGAGTTHCYEFDIVNEGSIVDIQPYQPFITGATMNAWLASGGEITTAEGGAAASCALAIVNNAQTYRKGIVFHALALDGCDGITGSGVAISMAKGHVFQQLFTGGMLGSQLTFNVSNSAAQQELVFSDSGLIYRNSAVVNMFQVAVSNTFVNGLKVTPANTGTGVTLAPQGSDASIDLILSSKGAAGYIDHRNVQVVGTAGSQAGFKIEKINGTLYKVPYYNL